MARPRSTARDELLAAVVQHVAEHGIGDLSLRPLAAAIGTSHRMLLFHFGSKEQLMVEVVRSVEAQQRAAMATVSAQPGLSVAEQMRQQWEGYLDPALRNNIRLFFEVYADALRGRPGTAEFLEEATTSWLQPAAAALGPASGRHAAVDARLMIALTRGLLLDLVATGDVDGVDAAMRRFTELFERGTVAPAPARPARRATPANRTR
ncbi:MAG: TetR/AcrR family transcriptional regulator [Ilumatobacteraceae bacterium]